MFNQRQWAELNAFAASFGAGSNDGSSRQQAQPQHHQDRQFQNQHQHHHDLTQNHFDPSHQQQPPPPPQPQSQHHQHQQQQGQHNVYQYDFTPQQEWSGFSFDPAPPQRDDSQPTPNHHAQTSDFGPGPTDAMDWAPTADFASDFINLGGTLRHQDPGIKVEPDYMTRDAAFGSHAAHAQPDAGQNPPGGGSASNSSGVGRLIAQFENSKEMQPPLPPRPTHDEAMTDGNSVASPITINQQQAPAHFGHFASAAPQATSFGGGNSFAPNSFASNHAQTPSDTNFGSFGTPHSRVASPMARSPPPASFGSFRDTSHVGSPGPGPVPASSSDHFGSLDNFVASSRMADPSAMAAPSPMPMVSSPGPATPGHGTSGTPGFSIWRPPGQQQQQQQNHHHIPHQIQQPQQHSQGFHQYQQPVQQQQQQQQQPTHQRHPSQPPASSPGGGYFRPPPPPTPKPAAPNGGNQFILELNPGSKVKPKAPAKPPKPKAPKPTLPAATSSSFASTIKQEPSTPQPGLATPAAETGSKERVGSSTPQPQPGSRPPREQVPAESWEEYKSIIHDLYLEQRKPLKEVMSIMAEKYNFQATPKMYKTRFSQWGFVKNNTEDEVKKLLSMKFQRDAEGKVSEFVRNGKIINLNTYLKRKGVTEYDLVDFELPANLPSHIRCRTPTPPPAPDYLKAPDLVRAQELVVGNMRKAFLQCRQWEIETDRHSGWPSTMVWGAPSSEMLTEANFYFEASDVDSGGQCLMNAFNQLEIDLKQLSPQAILEVLLGMVRRDPGLMTALCKYVAAFSTTNYDRAHPLRQIFTCLYEVQQKHGAVTLSELLWGSVPLVAEELEAIYSRRHPYVSRTWTDLALFYDQRDPDRLEKLAVELRLQHRQLEQGGESELSELLALRYAIAQLFYAADPASDASKQAAKDLFKDMQKNKLLFRVRDSRPNVYCYHCAVKNDPWTKRCRRRYDSVVELLEKHVDVKVLPYFEEDFHTMHHEPEAQTSWSAVMGQPVPQSRWGFF